jgi:hypothetical protein
MRRAGEAQVTAVKAERSIIDLDSIMRQFVLEDRDIVEYRGITLEGTRLRYIGTGYPDN